MTPFENTFSSTQLNLLCIRSSIGSQIELALKEAPKGNPNSKYFIGRDEI